MTVPSLPAPMGKALRRLVLLIGLTLGLESTLFSCLSPLLPHFANAFGLSKSAAGFLTGSYPAGVIAGALAVGRLRRLDPRSVTLVGMVIFAAATFAFGFAHNVVLLDLTRLIAGLGCGGIWAGGLAWLAKSAQPGTRGRSLGIVMGAATAGTMIGPLLGTLAGVIGLPIVFSVMGAVSVLAAIAIAMTKAPGVSSSHVVSLLASLRNRNLAVCLWVLGFPFLGGGVLAVLIPLQLSPKGGAGVEVGLTFFLASTLGTLLCVVAGHLSDRRGRMLPIRVGIFVSTPLAGVLALTGSVPVVIICTIGYLGWAYSFLTTPTMALITDIVHGTELEAAAPAMQILSMAVTTLIGAWVGAAAAQAIGNSAIYGALAALGCITLALLRFAAGTVPASEPGSVGRAVGNL